MPKLSEVLVGMRETFADFNGVKVAITYDPNQYTPAKEAEWEELTKQGEGRLCADFVISLVRKWDLEEDDEDKVIPLEPERVAKMSIMVLDGIIQAIQMDVTEMGKERMNRAQRRAQRKSS